MRSLSVLLVLSLVSMSAPASADPATSPTRRFGPIQPGALLTQAESLGTSEADEELVARLAALQEQRDAVRSGGPTAAMIAGGVATGIGVLMMSVTGLVCAERWSDCDHTSTDNLFYGFGGAAAGLGVSALLIGAVKLRESKQQRRQIDRQILDVERRLRLERARSVGIGFVAGGKPGLSLQVAF